MCQEVKNLKKCFKYLKIIFLLVVLWIMIISFSIKVNAFSFKPYTYRLDSTGKYILNIKGYTTLKKFKNNIKASEINNLWTMYKRKIVIENYGIYVQIEKI